MQRIIPNYRGHQEERNIVRSINNLVQGAERITLSIEEQLVESDAKIMNLITMLQKSAVASNVKSDAERYAYVGTTIPILSARMSREAHVPGVIMRDLEDYYTRSERYSDE